MPALRIPISRCQTALRNAAPRRGASSPRIGVERGEEPRRRGQLDELRLDIRLRGRHVGTYHCAVVAHEKLERLPERAVRPADGHSLAIAQRGEIGGLDRRALRFPFPHRLDDLMQPGPTLRRDARAALIDSPPQLPLRRQILSSHVRHKRSRAWASCRTGASRRCSASSSSARVRFFAALMTTPLRSRGAFLRPGFAPLLRSPESRGGRSAERRSGAAAPVGRAVSRLKGGGNSVVISMPLAPSVPMVSQTEIDPMKTALSPVLASYCLRNGRARL